MRPRIFEIRSPVGRLAILAAPRGGDELTEELSELRSMGIDTLVSLLTDDENSERQLSGQSAACVAAEIEPLRYPINDRSVPPSEITFREFLNCVSARLRAGKFVAVHCRAGIGRSSLVAASALATFNIKIAEAFEQISKTRGCKVPDTPEQIAWAEKFVRTIQNA